MGDKDRDILDDCAAALVEHYDSVYIFATKMDEDGGVQGHTIGKGNFYATLGKVREWLLQQDQRARTQINRIDEADSEDEPWRST